MPKPIRASASRKPSSSTGQARRNLYSLCIKRINKALDDDYVLEAVTLIESLIADRLESRLAHLHKQDPKKRKFSTIGTLSQELMGKKLAEPEEAREIYESIGLWSKKRNAAIHEFAKLREGSSKKWETKYKEAKSAANNGLTLFRDLDKLVRKLNRR